MQAQVILSIEKITYTQDRDKIVNWRVRGAMKNVPGRNESAGPSLERAVANVVTYYQEQLDRLVPLDRD